MSVTPSDLLADLPDPRDDEPSSLRSDIAEELTDHLVCSVRREMVKGADEPTAWERALKRFGDPRQIVRKLWWLAMRRRIMNQRLMLGLQGAMLLAVIAVAAAMIQMSNAQQRQMAQQQEVLTTVLAKLGKRLEEPATPVTPSDPNRNRVQIRVVEGNADGPVITTATAWLTQPDWEKPLAPVIEDDGTLDFGYLDAGVYSLTTLLKWGPKGERRFVVHPGKNVVETVVAPVSPEHGLEVRIVAPLPAKLREAGVVLQLDPQPAGFAAPFEAWKWETEGFYDTIRGTSGGGRLPPIRLTEQAGDSLIGTITLPPGTYICPTASLRDRDLKRVLAQGKLLNHDHSGIARPNEGIITLTKPDQEWRIDLPTNLVGGALDALTTPEPASK